uniref:Acyl-[acyl-carrier-protein] hydrolase n=1 Tax=Zea mays TaxID=4577 RepID=A0A804Q8B1_MAIZE
MIYSQILARGDIVEVDTWISANGKNGMRRHWHVHDSITGHTILKVTRFTTVYNTQGQDSVVLEMNINGRCLHLDTVSLRMWSSRLCNSCSLPISEGIRPDRLPSLGDIVPVLLSSGHKESILCGYKGYPCWQKQSTFVTCVAGW